MKLDLASEEIQQHFLCKINVVFEAVLQKPLDSDTRIDHESVSPVHGIP